ncbi:hypothetical protein [Microbulbifer magnicolonia]|uniref:hypothetical protein n=1 Tax=Microbulbifer magnicolonia TaxID=3109744 RepID=UPI003BF4AD32
MHYSTVSGLVTAQIRVNPVADRGLQITFAADECAVQTGRVVEVNQFLRREIDACFFQRGQRQQLEGVTEFVVEQPDPFTAEVLTAQLRALAAAEPEDPVMVVAQRIHCPSLCTFRDKPMTRPGHQRSDPVWGAPLEILASGRRQAHAQ